MLQVQFVDASHELQIGSADRASLIIDAAAADAGNLKRVSVPQSPSSWRGFGFWSGRGQKEIISGSFSVADPKPTIPIFSAGMGRV